MTTDQRRGIGAFLTSRVGIAAIAFLAIAGYFLWSEHEAHVRAVVPYLPYLLLLACPLLHVLMHGGHGGESGHDHAAADHNKAGKERQ
jgi:uncharacterized membrane protein